MNQVNQKSDLELAQRLSELSQLKKEIEKEYARLREYFLNRMDQVGVNTITFGNVALSISQKSRCDLDKKLLITALGESEVERFMRQTLFRQLNIEVVASELRKAA
ncbi:MAG: hypothetical protein A4S09_06255 [Proteobacteria bacterium SG_bin7]|nr:MAG: hypothetical protein A4S09_06255 [Proteobacteria bacterium SG_bin7]